MERLEDSNNRHGKVFGQTVQVRHASDFNSFAVRPFLSKVFIQVNVVSKYTNMARLSTGRASSKIPSTCSLRTVTITCYRVSLLQRQRAALTLSSSALANPRHLHPPYTPYDRAFDTFAIDLLAFLLHVPLAPRLSEVGSWT